MILEADFGRFICVFAQFKPNSALELRTYMAVARALTELHPEENVLATSHDQYTKLAEARPLPKLFR